MGIENKLNYKSWLRSEKWHGERVQALGWQQMICQGCEKVSENNHAHHIIYPGDWNKTRFWMLRILCKKCHKKIHLRTSPNDYKKRKMAVTEYRRAINAIRKRNGLRGLPCGTEVIKEPSP